MQFKTTLLFLNLELKIKPQKLTDQMEKMIKTKIINVMAEGLLFGFFPFIVLGFMLVNILLAVFILVLMTCLIPYMVIRDFSNWIKRRIGNIK